MATFCPKLLKRETSKSSIPGVFKVMKWLLGFGAKRGIGCGSLIETGSEHKSYTLEGQFNGRYKHSCHSRISAKCWSCWDNPILSDTVSANRIGFIVYVEGSVAGP